MISTGNQTFSPYFQKGNVFLAMSLSMVFRSHFIEDINYGFLTHSEVTCRFNGKSNLAML